MSQLLGLLNIAEAAADRTYVNTIGQRVVYEAVQKMLADFNAEIAKVKRVFVEGQTSDHKLRYKLPGGGRLQRRGGLTVSGAVKAQGQWDCELPLEDFGVQFGGDEISLAYMTAKELDRHLDTVFIQDINTVRFEILKALFNSSARSFSDEIRGSLTVQPLANGDSVVYPPVLGSETEATDNHYLESGYLASAISDTNNPLVTIVNELEEHFGAPSGGSNIVVFINNAETAKVSALTAFDEVIDRFVTPGDNVNTLTGLPASLPGRIIGRANGAWVSEWRFIPANYMLGLHMDAPAPLMERVDPADTGLGTGFQLVADDEEWPLKASHYRHRFGFGAGNRLNGVALELGNGGTYTIPTAYA